MTKWMMMAGLVISMAGRPAGAIDLVFDYSLDTYEFSDGTVGFFNKFPEAKADLELAGRVFERFQDNLAAIEPSSTADPIDVDPFTGPYDVWAALISHPGTGQSNYRIAGLTIAEDTVVVYAGGRNLGGSTLGVGGGGGYSTFVGTEFETTLKTRGQGTIDEVTGVDAVEIAPWGGSISFDTVDGSGAERLWNFGAAPTSADVDKSDFLSVAIHELAHLMGFSFSTPSFANQVSGGQFTGAAAEYYNDGPVALAGDLSHFAEGTLSEVRGVTQETAMDPTLRSLNGISDRKLFTDLDYAVMRDLGWMVPLIGDANVDGSVDIADLVRLSQNFGVDEGVDWIEGDFNLDGIVDIADLVLLSQNYGQEDPLSPSSASVNAASTPEPGTLGMLGAITMLIAKRRRRMC
ncbi:PEP-CTERM sorting domain-containing protein [Planctomycetales bacterium ZRK34]|nr:PEP-CTERM sorting domain-containing protein [Planctomycetales bacterium ZRK34]